MIHAHRNGQRAKFSEHVWELLPDHKEGWDPIKVDPPAEVKAAVVAKATTKPAKKSDVSEEGGEL